MAVKSLLENAKLLPRTDRLDDPCRPSAASSKQDIEGPSELERRDTRIDSGRENG